MSAAKLKKQDPNLTKPNATQSWVAELQKGNYMCNREISTIAIFSSRYEKLEEAADAGELYSVDVEYPMTFNDLSLLCESVAKAVGVPGGVKYGFVAQPEVKEEDI